MTASSDFNSTVVCLRVLRLEVTSVDIIIIWLSVVAPRLFTTFNRSTLRMVLLGQVLVIAASLRWCISLQVHVCIDGGGVDEHHWTVDRG